MHKLPSRGVQILRPRAPHCTQIRSVLGRTFPWSCNWTSPHAEHEDKWRFYQRLWHDRNPAPRLVDGASDLRWGKQCNAAAYWCTVQHKWAAAQRLDYGKARERYDRLVWTISFLNLETHSVTTAVCEALRVYATGIIAGISGNVDTANEVGEKILTSMAQQNVLQHSFKKKDQAVTLGCQSQQWINTDRSTTVVSKAHRCRISEWPVGRDFRIWTLQLSPSNSKPDMLWGLLQTCTCRCDLGVDG